MTNNQALPEIGGSGLLKKYNGSLPKLLSKVYPDYNWLPWKFGKCPHNYWDNIKNHKKFMDWAATQLNIKVNTDWYNVSSQVVKN
jgi:hypothetical protein